MASWVYGANIFRCMYAEEVWAVCVQICRLPKQKSTIKREKCRRDVEKEGLLWGYLTEDKGGGEEME